MNRVSITITLCLLLTAPGSALAADKGREGGPFINWSDLKNPVLSVPDRMLKDQAVVYFNGWFYVFCSIRFESGDPNRHDKIPCIYKTRDFRTYECLYDDDLNIRWGSTVKRGTGSPDLTYISGVWHMVRQSGPDGTGRRNIFYSMSDDLEDWGPSWQLNPGLRLNARRIDGALAYEGGYYFLGYKSRQRFRVTRSKTGELDGRWLRSRSADAGGGWAENYQFIKIDGTWRMIATARDPDKPMSINDYTGSHEPFIYTMDGDGSELTHWTRWVDKRHLEVPLEDWNRVMHANSAYLCDWREYDGYFYLFYAGANDSESFERRGHGKIGVVRSRDLADWRLPGEAGD
jgi:hypothetical protein